MRSSTLLPLVSLLAAAPLAAQAADTRPAKPEMTLKIPDYAINTQVFDFPTGLRVMFQSDRSYPIASVFMIVNHGSSDDPEGKDETAHFVEHTWFRSVHGNLPPIMDTIQDLGTLFNATTHNDWTDYRTTASSEYLPILLRLESLRLTEFYKGMTEDQTTTEREVIRNEWRRRNEQNQSLLFDYLYNVVYPEGHPYHSTSTHDTIDHIKLADLQGYVDAYYKPENTTIMVVGDFSADDASSLLFENFDPKLLHPELTSEMMFLYPRDGITNPDQANPAHWRTGAYDPIAFKQGKKEPFHFVDTASIKPRLTEQREAVPPVGSKEVAREKAPIDNPTAVVGWSLPGGYRSDQTDLQMLGFLAGNVMLNGLTQMYPKKGTFNMENSGCFTQTEIVNSTLMCLVEIKDSSLDPEDMTEKMLDQFAVLWNPDLTVSFNQQFSRSRNEFLAQELLNMDLVASIFGGRADNIGTFAHYTANPNYYSNAFEQIMNVDGQKLGQMAYEFMKRDRAGRLVVEPLPEDDIDVTSAESGASYSGASAGDDQVLRTSDDLSRVTDASIKAAYIHPDVNKIHETKLANGLRVVVMPHGEAPLVRASVVFGGGALQESQKGLFDFATNFSQGEGNDPLQIAGQTNYPFIPGIAGIFSSVSYPVGAGAMGNAWRLDFDAPAGNLDGALWMLRGEVESAHPYLDGAQDWKSRREKSLKSGWGQLGWHLDDVTRQHLYPNAPNRNLWTWEQVQTAKAFNADTVQAYLDQHLQPSNATLLIVGNVNADEATRMAEQYFGGWQAKSGVSAGWAPAATAPAMPTAPTRVLIFDDPKKTQTESTLTCRLNYAGEQEKPAVDVLGSLLSARTFSTLRVKEALAYSPFAYSNVSDDGSAVLVYSSLAVNKGVGRTVQFFIDATKDLAGGNVKAEEVTLHKLRMARESGLSSQSIDQMTGRLTGAIRNQKDWTYITGRGDDIAGVNPDQMVKLVQGCADHAIVTLHGPKDVIGPQLQEKGIPYEVVDFEARGDELLGKYDPKALKKKQKAKAKEDAKKAKEEGEAGEGTDEAPAPTPAPTPAPAVLARED